MRLLLGGLLLAGSMANASATGAIEALESFVAGTTRASGRFTQVVAGGSRATGPESGAGRFAFERPGRFRWELLEPYHQIMVADGRDVRFYDPDLEQLTIRPLAEAMGATPAAILFGSGRVDAAFALADAGSRAGLDWLVATPREGDAGFEAIRIGFDGALPRAMEVDDAFGRTIRFEFADIDLAPDLKPDTFRLDVPPGTDVVRQ